MSSASEPLPEFDKPPLVEVALSVQFESLTKLRTPQIGLLWQQFREQFPHTEEYPPLDPIFERFGVPSMALEGGRFQLLPSIRFPRVWFLNQATTELVQIQQDRFIHNWRRVSEQDAYPRYEPIRGMFEDELTRFRDFVTQNHLGDFCPNQCEVTYVNHITAGEGWSDHSQISQVLTPFSTRFTDSFLPSPEDGRLSIRFLIPSLTGEPLGRLHVSAEPAFLGANDAPILVITLTARCRPTTTGIPGVLGFLDIGREWIVRGFTSVTTKSMHRVWGRGK